MWLRCPWTPALARVQEHLPDNDGKRAMKSPNKFRSANSSSQSGGLRSPRARAHSNNLRSQRDRVASCIRHRLQCRSGCPANLYTHGSPSRTTVVCAMTGKPLRALCVMKATY